LLTNDERVNIEAAFIARLKNPEIRLVLRSAQPNLNEHLSHQLDNLVAFEPTEISSAAFALAALGDETRGSFYINGKLVQIIERRIQKNDPFVSQSVANLNRHHRILAHCRKTDNFSKRFYQWHPEHTIKERCRSNKYRKRVIKATGCPPQELVFSYQTILFKYSLFND
jgi:hypothetical protein